jgi:hypothetical protein
VVCLRTNAAISARLCPHLRPVIYRATLKRGFCLGLRCAHPFSRARPFDVIDRHVYPQQLFKTAHLGPQPNWREDLPRALERDTGAGQFLRARPFEVLTYNQSVVDELRFLTAFSRRPAGHIQPIEKSARVAPRRGESRSYSPARAEPFPRGRYARVLAPRSVRPCRGAFFVGNDRRRLTANINDW